LAYPLVALHDGAQQVPEGLQSGLRGSAAPTISRAKTAPTTSFQAPALKLPGSRKICTLMPTAESSVESEGRVELRSPPEPADAKTSEALRAANILYRIGEGDLAMAFVTDLAEESSDPGVIAGLGKLTARYNDAQAMLLVGKAALARGMGFMNDLHPMLHG
jgi:hypothetical protein